MLVKPISRGHITGFIGDISPEGAAKAAAAASRAVVLRETVDAAAMAERVAVDSALALVTGTKRAAYQAVPLPNPSVNSVAPRSPGTLSDTAFVLFSMFILFHMDSSLCSVSPSSRIPTPRADPMLRGAMGYGPQVAHISRALAPDKAEAVVRGGSPSPVQNTTVVAPTIPSTGASSPQPETGAASTSVVAGDDIAEDPKVVHGDPLLRSLGGVSLYEAMGTTH
jgi:hypothetical protein